MCALLHHNYNVHDMTATRFGNRFKIMEPINHKSFAAKRDLCLFCFWKRKQLDDLSIGDSSWTIGHVFWHVFGVFSDSHFRML